MHCDLSAIKCLVYVSIVCLYNQKYIYFYFLIINFLPKSCSVKKKDLVPSLKNIHLNNYFLCLICLVKKIDEYILKELLKNLRSTCLV